MGKGLNNEIYMSNEEEIDQHHESTKARIGVKDRVVRRRITEASLEAAANKSSNSNTAQRRSPQQEQQLLQRRGRVGTETTTSGRASEQGNLITQQLNHVS